MEKKARTGVWVGGTVPYGYRIRADKKGIVIHEDEALVIRKIFTTYAEGKDGAQTLRDQLTAMGIHKRSGKRWTAQTLLHTLRNPVYCGKLRWKDDIHPGAHQPIVSQEVFDHVGAILESRGSDLKGRQWHNGNARLLSGVSRCALCGSPVVGVSANKKGRKFSYYACIGRLRKTGCTLAYIRAEELEQEIVRTFRELFRSDDMVDRIWKETAQLLDAERPDIEAELSRIERDVTAATAARDRYFASFEAGTLSAADCGPRLEEIGARVRTLQTRTVELEAARTRLALPALDRAAVAALMDDFETVFDSGTNGQKKNLLRMLVKEVRVHSRDEAEVWFTFPRPQEASGEGVPEAAGMTRSETRRGGPTGDPPRTLADMAPEVGFEPTTLRLTAGCSAVELLRNSGRAGAPGPKGRPEAGPTGPARTGQIFLRRRLPPHGLVF
jgi:site-specific DNA recombinase